MVRRAMDERNPGAGRLPPVDKWNPPFCGDLDMEIRADGTWFYMGTPMGRLSLVRLFSSILRKDEDGDTYLVTPVEKVRIRVADAHFLAVEMSVERKRAVNQVISFRTNVGDVVEIGKNNPLHFKMVDRDSELKPYFRVRGRLEALVNRATMYELVELGEEVIVNGTAMFAIRSNRETYPIMTIAELNMQSA